ncbi:MAG: TadE family protein [Anaerolineales bacterium]
MTQRGGQGLVESGQSLTEFAISITFVLILLAGIVDLGRAFFVLISLQDAAQEGAAYAAIAPTDTTGIRQRVRQGSGSAFDVADLTDSQIDILVTGSACAGNSVKLTLEYDFEFLAPFAAGKTLPLRAEIIDRILQPPC